MFFRLAGIYRSGQYAPWGASAPLRTKSWTHSEAAPDSGRTLLFPPEQRLPSEAASGLPRLFACRFCAPAPAHKHLAPGLRAPAPRSPPVPAPVPPPSTRPVFPPAHGTSHMHFPLPGLRNISALRETHFPYPRLPARRFPAL